MSRFFKENQGYLAALTIVGAFLYIWNLHGPLFWDDADWIVNNVTVHALTWANIKFIFSHDALAGIGMVSNYYRPVLFLTFLANWLMSGANPALYHAVNDGLHILNTLLIFGLLGRWLESRRAAFLAALFFLIQPLQTEAVAYVNSRGDSLSVFFMLAALWCFAVRKRRLAYALAVLAILSKEYAVMLPAYLIVALTAFEYQGAFWPRLKKAFAASWPFVGISAAYAALRLTALNFQNTLNFYQQQNIYSEHLTYRLYTFCHALLVYLRLALWPTGLHMDRDIPVSTSIFTAWVWLGALVILAILLWLLWLYRTGKREMFNLWFFGAAVFFVNLAPTSGIVPINARIYEHWLYFSLFGLFAVVGWHLDTLWRWIEGHRPRLQPALVTSLVVYCLFFGIQTILRNILWTDVEGMYLDILHYEPDDVRVLNNLGNWYSDRGQLSDAAPLYERAIQDDPSQPAPYYNLGNIARDTGQPAQAETLYKKALAASPAFYYAYGNLAQLYVDQKRYREALAELEALQKIRPTPETAENILTLQRLLPQ